MKGVGVNEIRVNAADRAVTVYEQVGRVYGVTVKGVRVHAAYKAVTVYEQVARG